MRQRAVWWVFGGAVVLRLLVLPLNHTWDVQVWYNVFADLAHNHSPYDTFRELSLATRSAKVNMYYEYFAYPPGLLYLDYPLARLYHLFDPTATLHIPAPGTIPTFPIPLIFNLFFKLPILAADLAIGWLLRKRYGLRQAALYLYNPYVLLMFTWMFDSLMVLCILLALHWLERGKIERCAVALAFGTLLKYVPILLVPVVVIYLFQRGASLKQMARFVAVYGAVAGLLALPFADGLAFVLGFHGQRVGGGLTWQALWNTLTTWLPTTRWDDTVLSTSGALGTITLGLGMLVAYALIYRFRLPPAAAFIVALTLYLATTKLVNEVYVLPLLPLLLGESLRAGLRRCYTLLWSLPLAWVIVAVPFYHFAIPLLNTLQLVDIPTLQRLDYYLPWHAISLAGVIIGVGFTALCILTCVLTLRAHVVAEPEIMRVIVAQNTPVEVSAG